MKSSSHAAILRCVLVAAFAAFAAAAASAQVPAPIAVPIAETAIPIVINTVKPHKGAQPPKFEGTVLNATIAQITVRAKGNDMAIQTFPLTPEASAKMLQIIDKGGYQYGDKVTVFYDPDNMKAFKVKGKPSKAI
jgi:hypothetical protein